MLERMEQVPVPQTGVGGVRTGQSGAIARRHAGRVTTDCGGAPRLTAEIPRSVERAAEAVVAVVGGTGVPR